MSADATRILIVDDSPTVRRLAELILSQQGYVVHTAEDGEQGLDVARRVKPDAILVDYVMPKMNGHSFCKHLREDPAMQNVPLILISSKGEAVGEAFEKEFGVVHYFSKPFEPDDLINKLVEVLGSVEEEPAMETVALGAGGVAPAAVENIVDKVLRQYFQKDFPLLMRNVLSDTLSEAGLVQKRGMVLSGDLAEVMLPDVINFAYNSRLSGRLTVFSREVFGEIFIAEGHFIFATASRKGSRNIFLTDLLKKDGRLTADAEEINQCVAEARSRNIPIGRVLVERKMLSEDELMEYLRQHAQDAFGATLDVKEGNFFLERDELPTNLQDLTIRIPLISVLMEGLSHLDEKHLAASEFKDEEMVLVRLITNEDALDTVNLQPRELELFGLIDGKKTLREVIALSQLEPLETKRICYALRKVGLLRVKTH
ncbi:MAG: response regulator [Deltaproteobacteria bacterium]|nr:response regulator [Deltaproteobacteria bacterium]NCP02599.1 response regulator [Deltaproteobacteria bacterium]